LIKRDRGRRQTTDGRATANSKREREFTFAKNGRSGHVNRQRLLAGQLASNPGNSAYMQCYPEPVVSSLEVSEAIVGTHCATHEGVARLSWPG